MSEQLLRKAFLGTRWILLTTIIQKCFTFLLTYMLVRATSPDVFGMAAVQLELTVSTLLFLSREGIRLTAIRLQSDTRLRIQQLINLSWLPLLILLTIGLIAIATPFLYKLDFKNETAPSILALAILYVSALTESLGEPWYNFFNNNLYVIPKLRAETIGITIRSILTYFLVGHLHFGVFGFLFGQLFYSLSYFLTLFSHSYTITNETTNTTPSIFLPKLLPIQQDILKKRSSLLSQIHYFISVQIGPESLSILQNTFLNSFLKHILTEADKISLTLFASHYNQGIYAVANNYCSLIARICYLPLEEASRLTFARMITAIQEQQQQQQQQRAVPMSDRPHQSDSDSSNLNSDRRDDDTYVTATLTPIVPNSRNIDNPPGDKQQPPPPASWIFSRESAQRIHEQLQEMSDILTMLLRVMVHFGLFFPAFGPSYVKLLVYLLFSGKWFNEDMVSTLSAFCLYLLIIGCNGISEAFVMSVLPKHQYFLLNVSLICSSLTFIVLISPLMDVFATSGLVLANGVSMAVRIVFNLMLIYRCFKYPQTYLNIHIHSKDDTDDTNQVDNSNQQHNPSIHNDALKNPVFYIFPHYLMILTFTLCHITVRISSDVFLSTAAITLEQGVYHICIGIVAFLICFGVFFHLERIHILRLVELIRGNRKIKTS